MRLLLALLLQQFQYVARFGNLGEIQLGLDFPGCRLFPGGAGFRGKILPDPIRFIFFYGA
jgi:hypothetical protein